jgi:cell division protein FtsL
MSKFNIVLVLAVLGACMSLVTSRQQQRLDFAAIEKAQAHTRRLEQDYQNLTAKQQQLEQTERIERIARIERSMERIAAARTVLLSQSKLP